MKRNGAVKRSILFFAAFNVLGFTLLLADAAAQSDAAVCAAQASMTLCNAESDAASASNINGRNSHCVWSGTVCSKPTPVAPIDRAAIRTQSRGSARVRFEWRAPPEASAPELYRLCVAEPGVGCDTRRAIVYDVGAVNAFSAEVPTHLHGKSLQWSVAACASGDCVWSAARTFSVSDRPERAGPDSVIAPCD